MAWRISASIAATAVGSVSVFSVCSSMQRTKVLPTTIASAILITAIWKTYDNSVNSVKLQKEILERMIKNETS